MKIKKTLAIILAALMISSAFIGCDKSSDKKENDDDDKVLTAAKPLTADEYIAAENKTAKVNMKTSTKSDITMKITYSGTESGQPFSMYETTKITSEDTYEYLWSEDGKTIELYGTQNGTSELIGSSETDADIGNKTTSSSKIYYKDGFVYSDTELGKIKMACSLDQLMDEISGGGLSELSLTSEMLVDYSAVPSGTNNNISYKLDVVKLLSAIDESFSTMIDGTELTGALANISVVVDKDGYVISEKMDMAFTTTSGEDGMKIEMEMNIAMESVNSDIGKVTAVTVPSDLDKYIESEM